MDGHLPPPSLAAKAHLLACSPDPDPGAPDLAWPLRLVAALEGTIPEHRGKRRR